MIVIVITGCFRDIIIGYLISDFDLIISRFPNIVEKSFNIVTQTWHIYADHAKWCITGKHFFFCKSWNIYWKLESNNFYSSKYHIFSIEQNICTQTSRKYSIVMYLWNKWPKVWFEESLRWQWWAPSCSPCPSSSSSTAPCQSRRTGCWSWRCCRAAVRPPYQRR